MEAAKHGNSTLGIPQAVGAEYVAADTAKSKRKPVRAEYVRHLAHALTQHGKAHHSP